MKQEANEVLIPFDRAYPASKMTGAQKIERGDFRDRKTTMTGLFILPRVATVDATWDTSEDAIVKFCDGF